jgi:hypothetical protein
MIGIIEVDSGTVVVGDPLYTLPSQERGKPGIDYSAVLTDVESHGRQLAGQPVVLLANFGGDGAYPVYGEFEDSEFMRATIEFEPLELHDEDGEGGE